MKKIILLFSIFVTAISVSKAQSLAEVVISMPDELIIPLSADQKEILFDTTNDTAKVVAQNVLGGDVERLAISPDFIELKTSDVGSTQLKLLPLINDSYIIGVIQTVCDSTVCDSQISFYTTDWKPLNQVDIFPNKDKNWFIQPSADKSSQAFTNAYAALDMTPISLRFSPNNPTVEAVYTIRGYLSPDDYKLIKPYLLDQPKVFYWNKVSFQ